MILIHPPTINPIPSAKVDISLLLKPDDEEEEPFHQHYHHHQQQQQHQIQQQQQQQLQQQQQQQHQQQSSVTRPPSSSSSATSSRRTSMLVSSGGAAAGGGMGAGVGGAGDPMMRGQAPMMASTLTAKPPTILSSTSSTPSTMAGTKRHSSGSLGNEPPAKKQSKWSPEEDSLIIELRGRGMKWEDISKKLPGRSAISCRLHYQNYLERRSEWDEDRKNKLARLYERFKAEMWAKVAEEMAIPWRAAEAMHWQLGEQEMARRAGVVPFSLSSSSTIEPSPKVRRNTTVMPRLRRQSMSVASVSQRSAPPPPPPHPLGMPQGMPPQGMSSQGMPQGMSSQGMPQGMSSQGMSQGMPQGMPQGLQTQVLPPHHGPPPPPPSLHSDYHPGPSLPQPHPQGQSQGQPQLPSVEELTAGVPAYSSPHTQSIIDPYHRGVLPPPQQQPQPPMNLPHPPTDLPGMSPMTIPRTRP